jgi:hypothetical protein
MTTKTTTPGTEEGIDLDKLEARALAATPGPWKVRIDGTCSAAWPHIDTEALDEYGDPITVAELSCSHVETAEARESEEMPGPYSEKPHRFELKEGEPALCDAELIVATRNALPALIALARRAAPMANPIGQADPMPGASGFTMACFKASDVPVGTKLYLAPSSTDSTQAAVLEQIAQSWDGCMVDAPGETMDVGATLRSQFKQLANSTGAQAAVEEVRAQDRWNFMMRIVDNNDGPESREMTRQVALLDDDDPRPESEQVTEVVDAAISALKSTTAQAATEGDKS